MNGTQWACQVPPCAPSTASEVWRGDVVSPAAITFSRSLLRRQISRAPLPRGMHEGDVEVLLLAYEELASNAIRHGRQPVNVMITTLDDGWLVDVVDGAAECVPEPPIDRDPAEGGLGLDLVARLCAAHGWWPERERKHVWACVHPDDRCVPARDGGYRQG